MTVHHLLIWLNLFIIYLLIYLFICFQNQEAAWYETDGEAQLRKYTPDLYGNAEVLQQKFDQDYVEVKVRWIFHLHVFCSLWWESHIASV